MFGLELWFVLSVASAVLGGVYIFVTKVAAERDYDIVLLSAASLVISGTLFLGTTILLSDFSGITPLILGIIAINALSYLWGNIVRHNGMRCIDTAIYYPIYKTLTPLFVIMFGVALFHERFSSYEWIGLAASLAVPLLLISRAEKARQRDLYRGLRLLLLAAVLATVAAITLKRGTELTDNIWFFTTLVDFGIALSAIAVLFLKNGKHPIRSRVKALSEPGFISLVFWFGVLQYVSFGALIFAIKLGPLGIVYTINSLYILIPIVLSIIYYHEHWNARKVIAIFLSIAALGLLK